MSEVPDDLMKVARETIPDHPIAWDAPVLRNRVARALAAERERATLAEREKWQIPPGPTYMGFPVRFDPSMAPGETRVEDKDGNVIGRIVNARP